MSAPRLAAPGAPLIWIVSCLASLAAAAWGLPAAVGQETGLLPDEALQEDSLNPARDTAKIAKAREATLKWLDNYLRRQVLFEDADMERIRTKVAKMSPSDLERWLASTETIRRELESPAWRETEAWMRKFLDVQAIYSDEEIAEFRRKVADSSPEQLHEILADIQQKHRARQWRGRNSEKVRQAQLQARNQLVQNQASAQRTAAKKSSSTKGRPLFGPSQATAQRRSNSTQPYQRSRPLVTSGDVAREAVRREIFPGYRLGW